ncbi:MAG: FIST N-terminal domain-containing protein [Acidobacteriota bacterium]
MDCTTHALAPTPDLAAQLAAIEADRPDLVLAFLPPGPNFRQAVDQLAERWPDSLRCGCEALSQFVDQHHHSHGALMLLSVGGSADLRAQTLDASETNLAAGCRDADASLLLFAGRCSLATETLTRLRRQLRGDTAQPVIAGGLASADFESVARVFLDRQIVEDQGVVLWLSGVDVSLEVFAEWQPAGPFYRVTEAHDSTLHEIDGTSATEWFRRFFEVDGQLAPMPDAALRFPLILEGEDDDRRGLFRALRSFDDASGEVTFWGDLRTGDRVRFGIPADHSLLHGGRRPAPETREPVDFAVLMSCVGRELLLADRFEEEAIEMHRALGGAPLVGLTTLGEVGPSRTGYVNLHNQTAVLMRLREKNR